VLIVSVLLPEPPAASVTGELIVQVPTTLPLAVVTAQARATVPAKPFCEVTVMLFVLPVVAPEMKLMFKLAGER
jgi:hypothetical protein